MKQRVLCLLVLISVLTLVFASTSCTSGKNSERPQAGKVDKHKITVTFPEKEFIDDREVRFAVRKVSYPATLPVLSAKADASTDGELTGWFTAGGGKAERATGDMGGGYHFGDLQLLRKELPGAQPRQKSWLITGEETGTLTLTGDGAIMFSNPNEYRSYGALPKGNIANPNAKIIFARDMITEKEAVRGAEAYIESHGGLPADVKRKIIPGMSGLRIVRDGELVDPVDRTLWYNITYTHRFENVPIEPDKVEVNIDALGVVRYSRIWHTVQENGKHKDIVSPEDAVAATVKHYGYKIWSHEGLVISQTRLVYQPRFIETGQGNTPDDSKITEFHPAWFIRITGQEALVDAHTGEVIGQPWDSAEQRESKKAMKTFETNPLSEKIPVPVSITFIDGGGEIWHVRPTDAEFGPIFLEAQKILSKMRPYYKKQAYQHGTSGDTPQTVAEGGLRLEYDGKARFTTDSKVGRDIDEKDLPKDEKERRLNYSEDGFYRIYAQNIFICFNKSSVTSGTQPDSPRQASDSEPRTRVLSTTGPGYSFTYALASNDKLIEMTYKKDPAYIQSLLKSQP